MVRRKKKSDDLGLLLDVTEVFWWVGGVISILLAVATVVLAIFIYKVGSAPVNDIMSVFKNIYWVAYILPAVTGFYSFIFGVKAWEVRLRDRIY
ncbi:Uncharacterised protein [Plesiomonas shigelloides]|uniref:hypothetical protein n=1 Tax=Plesiomonas shigelloides TaxID=703 RepID=UPI0007ED5F24|nr:hypothetical protein [Plesiomonas shigelloides]SBT61305.1 Uncharacterised protein [Plesiomonas shigelloides]